MGKFTKEHREQVEIEQQEFVLSRVVKGVRTSRIMYDLKKTYGDNWGRCWKIYKAAFARAGMTTDATTGAEWRARIMAMVERVEAHRDSKPRDLLHAADVIMRLTGCGAADKIDVTLKPGGFKGVFLQPLDVAMLEAEFEVAPASPQLVEKSPALEAALEKAG